MTSPNDPLEAEKLYREVREKAERERRFKIRELLPQPLVDAGSLKDLKSIMPVREIVGDAARSTNNNRCLSSSQGQRRPSLASRLPGTKRAGKRRPKKKPRRKK